MLKVLRLNKLPYLGERSDAGHPVPRRLEKALPKGTLGLWQREAKGGLKAVESGLLAPFVSFSCPAACDLVAFKRGMTDRRSPFANNVLPFALNLRGAAHIRK